jgi:HD domain-containing protein
MSLSHPHPRSLHGLLITKLAAGALLISAVAAALAAFADWRRVTHAVADRAVLGAADLEIALGADSDLTDRAATARHLAGFCERRAAAGPRLTTGRFVVFRVLDASGVEIARCTDPAAPAVDTVVATLTGGAPRDRLGTSPVWTRMQRVNGSPYVEVLLPLGAGYVEAAFALSPTAITAARWNVVLAAALAVGTVLLATLFLYPVILQLLRRLEKLSRDLLDANLETLQVVGSAIAKRDSDTDLHNYRVTVYSVRLAEALRVDEAAIRILIKGAFLHDVGKIGIRDAILLKPGKLDEVEYREMQTHVRHGLDIVRRSAWLKEAEAVVGGHHERYDGSGYDDHSPGATIPTLARIFAVADVFDALSSKRPYKEPMSFERVIAILREGRGTHFDPDILDRFLEIARGLHETYATGDDGRAPRDLEGIIATYFKVDIAAFL